MSSKHRQPVKRKGEHSSHRSRTKGEGSKNRQGEGSSSSRVSFLFVINTLQYEYESRGLDPYGNILPPSHTEAYCRQGVATEIPSKVMRYRAGNIEAATGYAWYRPSLLAEGGICWKDGQGTINQAEPLTAATMFACNPHLPIIVAREDPVCTEVQSWEAVQLFHPHAYPGLSQAVFPDELTMADVGGSPQKFAAGHNASWIPGLLPSVYRAPEGARSTQSKGLGGDTAILLGLMAFSIRTEGGNDAFDNVFLGSRARFRGGRWHHDHRPAGYPASTHENPWGFRVTVCEDPQAPFEDLQDFYTFQRHTAFVSE